MGSLKKRFAGFAAWAAGQHFRRSVLPSWRAAAATLIGLVALTVSGASVNAQGQNSYVTAFPTNDVYDIHVYGDYYADGIASGLRKAFKQDRRVKVQQGYDRIKAIVRADFEEKLGEHADAMKTEPVPIAVIMIGGDDRGPLRYPDGARLQLETDAWRRAYGGRVDKLIKAFKGKGAAVYWVGLPILRRERPNQMAKLINDVIRERVYLNGAKFIDIYSAFADEDGDYDRFGPDLAGKVRKLRDSDGETFTSAGNRKLAHFVVREIKRDLIRAKAERVVPLAGSKAEQQRINPLAKAQPTAVTRRGWNSSVKKSAAAKRRSSARDGSQRRSREQNRDNSRVKLQIVDDDGQVKTVTVKLLRPAISAAIIDLVTRRHSPNKPAAMGDAVPGILQGGLTILSSITPSRRVQGGRRVLPPTHTPFYRALIKGEQLQPKPGRADDFRWPRPGAKTVKAPGASSGKRPRAAAPANALPRG